MKKKSLIKNVVQHKDSLDRFFGCAFKWEMKEKRSKYLKAMKSSKDNIMNVKYENNRHICA